MYPKTSIQPYVAFYLNGKEKVHGLVLVVQQIQRETFPLFLVSYCILFVSVSVREASLVT